MVQVTGADIPCSKWDGNQKSEYFTTPVVCSVVHRWASPCAYEVVARLFLLRLLINVLQWGDWMRPDDQQLSLSLVWFLATLQISPTYCREPGKGRWQLLVMCSMCQATWRPDVFITCCMYYLYVFDTNRLVYLAMVNNFMSLTVIAVVSVSWF